MLAEQLHRSVRQFEASWPCDTVGPPASAGDLTAASKPARRCLRLRAALPYLPFYLQDATKAIVNGSSLEPRERDFAAAGVRDLKNAQETGAKNGAGKTTYMTDCR